MNDIKYYKMPKGCIFMHVKSPINDNAIACVSNDISAIGWGKNSKEAEQLAIYLHHFYRLGGNANSSAEETKRIDDIIIKKHLNKM